jgi:multicomponent Na+:H+ antiporter subunit F
MLDLVVQVAVALLAVALLVTFLRLSLGPRLEDRVVAMDLMSVLTVGMIVTVTAGTRQRGLLDAASLIALVGFLGTVAYAWYVQKEEQR